MAINAGGVYGELELKTGNFKSGLLAAESQMQAFGNKMQSMGNKMQEMGGNLTKKLTVPIVGLSAVATKLGMDFEAGMSQVQAISGATGDDLSALTAKAKEMGATTKFSATEASEGLKYMAMAGWDTSQMLDGLEGIMMLAAASGEELGLVSDIVTDALTAFGMQASDAGKFADLLASASSNSNTNVAMMGETFKYVAPLFGALGYNADDAALAIGLMANAGIKGSQAGTTLRGAITRLVKPVGAAEGAIKDLGLVITDANDDMLPFYDIMVQLRGKFADLTKEQQAQYAATIFGQEAMSGMLAIINASPADFDKLTKATREYDGAAKDMAETMEDNLKGQITVLKSGLEGLALQIYEHLLPMLSKFVEWLQKLVDYLSNLSPATQKTIVVIAALVAGLGPLLLIGGKVIGMVSGLIGAFSGIAGVTGSVTAATATMSGGMKLLGAVITKLPLLLNPWVLGLGAVTVAGVKLYKHLQTDAIPAVELFGEGISEATQKAVGGFLDLEEKATMSLNQLNWSGQEITDEMAVELTNTFEEMKNQIVTKVEEQKDEATKVLQKMFDKSKDMTEEEKKKMLEITTKKYDEQIKKTEEGNEKIAEILARAYDENRALTEKEKNDINKIKEDMQKDAVRILSESEAEQKAIMERLRVESGKITAKQAAEVVKNSKEQKEKTIKEAEQEYKERLKQAAMLRAEGGKEAEQMADKIALEAKRQKEEAIKRAEEMHQGVVKEARSQAQEHVNQIDWESGQIKSKWQSLKSWFLNNPIIRKITTREDSVGKNARGTNYWKGGLTWVGEEGPELIELPKGSKVYSNEKSKQIAGSKDSGSGDILITGNTFNVRNDQDITKIARELYNLQQQQSRGRGLVTV